MKAFLSLFFSVLLAGLFIWSWFYFPEVQSVTSSIIGSSKLHTLEVRYSPETILEINKRMLLLDEDHILLESSLSYHPYLLMDVKYSASSEKTNEGILLWSLMDGEMVINTRSWETTHGFTDCLQASADKEDFRILNALASKGGALDRESLMTMLNISSRTLDTWIDKCRAKSLIVQTGNVFRIHLQNPKIQVIPETEIHHFLVSKEAKNAHILPRKFRPSQIEYIARSAFGRSFAIRKTLEVFLPVYSIVIQNPDGSKRTTFWNALTGKMLPRGLPIQ